MSAARVRRAAGLVLFVAFGIGVAIFLLGRVGTDVLPAGGKYKFEADVQSSVALASAADVRESGIRIGRVESIKQAGTITALQMSIDDRYAPVYRNAHVLIRAKSVAGENYVEVYPGDPQAGSLPSGGVLPVSQELEPTQDDNVFSILRARERANLGGALAGLGNGVSGAGGRHLNETLGGVNAVVAQGSQFAGILAEDRAQTARLIDQFGVVARALGNRAADVQTLTRSAEVAATAVSQRDAKLSATLEALPGLLSQARETSRRLGTFALGATPVMSSLRGAAAALVPTVTELAPASQAATATLRSLDRFSHVALPAFDRLRPFASTAEAFVGPYAQFLRQLNPFLSYLSPYYREVSSWFALAGAAVSWKDSVGNVARVLIPVSRSSLPSLPPQVDTLLRQLSGPLDMRGSNAYPSPAQAGTPGPGSPPPYLSPDPPYATAAAHR